MNEATEKASFMTYFNSCTTFNGQVFDTMLSRVLTYALKYGLEDHDMLTIAKVAFESRLSFTRIKKILRCLIPRIYVPNEVAEIVIKYLFKRFAEKESPIILNFLLHWLTGILQYKLILTKLCIYNHYDKFYELFHFEPIAVAACKVVYLLTSPDDVNKNRAEKLMKLHSVYKLKDKNHFGVLLRLFKCYKPLIVPDPIAYYSVNKNLGVLTAGINHSLASAAIRIKNNYKVVAGLNTLLWDKKLYQHIVLKRTEVQLIPIVPGNRITNQDISNLIVSGVVLTTLYKYDSDPPPSPPTSILSLINNPKDRYLIAHGDEIVQIRFCIELVVVLKDAFFFRKEMVPYDVRDSLLMKVSQFQYELSQAIPSATEFIGDYLKTWDGFEHQIDVLNIIEWLHIKSFSIIYETILLRVKKVFFNCSLNSKCSILISLSKLIENTLTFQAREKNGEKTLFLKDKVNLDFNSLFTNLLQFVQQCCINGISKEEGNSMMMRTIYMVYERILTAGKKVIINNAPAHSMIEYWTTFLSDYKILLRIGKIQNSLEE